MAVVFDPEQVQALSRAADAVCAAPVELGSVSQLADTLVTLQAAQNKLDGRAAATLAAFEAVDGPHEQGAASTAVWARTHLRLDTKTARARAKASRALKLLPEVAVASRAGRIRLDHVQEFTTGITKLGAQTMVVAQSWLVPVAKACEPAELRATINALTDVVHPDKLDDALGQRHGQA